MDFKGGHCTPTTYKFPKNINMGTDLNPKKTGTKGGTLGRLKFSSKENRESKVGFYGRYCTALNFRFLCRYNTLHCAKLMS